MSCDHKASWDCLEGQNKGKETCRTITVVFHTAQIVSEMHLTCTTTEFPKTLMSGKKYIVLIRNETLKVNSESTWICSVHFD